MLYDSLYFSIKQFSYLAFSSISQPSRIIQFLRVTELPILQSLPMMDLSIKHSSPILELKPTKTLWEMEVDRPIELFLIRILLKFLTVNSPKSSFLLFPILTLLEQQKTKPVFFHLHWEEFIRMILALFWTVKA